MKIEEIETLIEKAAPGPWVNNYDVGVEDASGNELMDTCRIFSENFSHEEVAATSRFIAASRTLIPKLLAVAKAVKEMPTLKIPHDVLDALEDLENEE